MKSRSAHLYPAVLTVLLLSQLLGACDLKDLYSTERKVKKDVYIEDRNVGGLKESEVLEIIESYARDLDKPAKDAAIDEKTWEVQPAQEGKKVNVEKTLEAVMNAEESEKVELFMEVVKPAVTAERLQAGIVEIASYSTPLLDRSEARVNNIRLAAERIDFKKLAPGEEFSFNETVGRRTEAKGYEEAPIIIRTEDGPKNSTGVGGGVCQLSTTIYNAVEECGLEVTERHMHSKKVDYVAKGEDATVSYGTADFKFRNNRKHPIMLRVHVTGKRVTVRILENRN